MKIQEVNDKNKFSFSAIYLWENLLDHKKYVGQAQNFYDRMRDYVSGQESDRVIGKAMNKYGLDNFEIIVLEKILSWMN